MFTGPCPVCGGAIFREEPVLWRELIEAWQLSEEEVDYINRQQGFHCCACNNNLRAMALASAILVEIGVDGHLDQLRTKNLHLDLLEINKAGNLTKYLSNINSHRLVEYPRFDMQNLDFMPESFDLVVHSDTLEHVACPEKALRECWRVLRTGGRCIFTVPIIVDRITRTRKGLPNSYHGQANIFADDQRVVTEFGSDFWKIILKTGFRACEIVALEYPAALAIVAKK